MKLYINNQHHFKTIPGKFSVIENIEYYLEDEHRKRLTTVERDNLHSALFNQQIENLLLKDLLEKEPLVMEQIAGAKAIAAYKVTTNDGQKYYVLKFDNNKSVRCSERLFRAAPTKGRLNYANGLRGNKIPPPCTEQLQLFSESFSIQ